MNINEKKSDERNAIVASWSLSIIKYAHFFFPGAVKSISDSVAMFFTDSFWRTWSRVPSPSIIPDLTVSLDWANRLNGALAGWSIGSFSNNAVNCLSVWRVKSWYTAGRFFSCSVRVLSKSTYKTRALSKLPSPLSQKWSPLPELVFPIMTFVKVWAISVSPFKSDIQFHESLCSGLTKLYTLTS